jgi:hypothetical protein
MRPLGHLRVLVDKLGNVVDLVVDDNVEILLGVVLSNILIGELLVGHLEGCLLSVWKLSVFEPGIFFWTAVSLARYAQTDSPDGAIGSH